MHLSQRTKVEQAQVLISASKAYNKAKDELMKTVKDTNRSHLASGPGESWEKEAEAIINSLCLEIGIQVVKEEELT